MSRTRALRRAICAACEVHGCTLQPATVAGRTRLVCGFCHGEGIHACCSCSGVVPSAYSSRGVAPRCGDCRRAAGPSEEEEGGRLPADCRPIRWLGAYHWRDCGLADSLAWELSTGLQARQVAAAILLRSESPLDRCHVGIRFALSDAVLFAVGDGYTREQGALLECDSHMGRRFAPSLGEALDATRQAGHDYVECVLRRGRTPLAVVVRPSLLAHSRRSLRADILAVAAAHQVPVEILKSSQSKKRRKRR